ncbi:hypothetical protein MSAN_02376600 [Mycena sanguinolenta]|uniref:Uncharacterized protein n=1 Tax=Mycena sanguinolenta TaxID=230812 RepID=A0A8H6X571_9AGAR|nr:hypothetical protein MSAN_02376600 [Mycena sanguinolenta]
MLLPLHPRCLNLSSTPRVRHGPAGRCARGGIASATSYIASTPTASTTPSQRLPPAPPPSFQPPHLPDQAHLHGQLGRRGIPRWRRPRIRRVARAVLPSAHPPLRPSPLLAHPACMPRNICKQRKTKQSQMRMHGSLPPRPSHPARCQLGSAEQVEVEVGWTELESGECGVVFYCMRHPREAQDREIEKEAINRTPALHRPLLLRYSRPYLLRRALPPLGSIFLIPVERRWTHIGYRSGRRRLPRPSHARCSSRRRVWRCAWQIRIPSSPFACDLGFLPPSHCDPTEVGVPLAPSYSDSGFGFGFETEEATRSAES